MATFFLLPPRPIFELSLARFLSTWLPGIGAPFTAGMGIAGLLQDHLAERDIFVIFREDLPDGADAEEALRHGFGAEWGDDVIELTSSGDRVLSRSWQVGAVSAA